jgi:hypothetical protein
LLFYIVNELQSECSPDGIFLVMPPWIKPDNQVALFPAQGFLQLKHER